KPPSPLTDAACEVQCRNARSVLQNLAVLSPSRRMKVSPGPARTLLLIQVAPCPSQFRPRSFGGLGDLEKLHRVGPGFCLIACPVGGPRGAGSGVEAARSGLQDR